MGPEEHKNYKSNCEIRSPKRVVARRYDSIQKVQDVEMKY